MTNREMRLRHLGLALVALTGIWIAVVIQRSHAPATSALASGPQPADVSAPRPKLVHVEGLSRPVAATPIVKVRSHPHVATPAAPARVQDVQVSPLETTEPSSAGAVAIDEDTRAAAVTPPPPHLADERPDSDPGRVRPRRADDLDPGLEREPRRARGRADRPRVLDDLQGVPPRGRRMESRPDDDARANDGPDGGPHECAHQRRPHPAR